MDPRGAEGQVKRMRPTAGPGPTPRGENPPESPGIEREQPGDQDDADHHDDHREGHADANEVAEPVVAGADHQRVDGRRDGRHERGGGGQRHDHRELRAFALRGEDAGICLAASGATRLVWSPLRFARLVKAAFDRIRQAAVGSPAVTIRLLQTLANLVEPIEDGRLREGLAKQVEAVWETASAEALVKSDREDVEGAYRRSCEALSSRARLEN